MRGASVLRRQAMEQIVREALGETSEPVLGTLERLGSFGPLHSEAGLCVDVQASMKQK